MSSTQNRTALWTSVLLDDGAIKHVRTPVAIVTVTPAQAFLGLGA
jgi:hypothetical protein